MTVTVWRLVRSEFKHPDMAFSGEGAYQYGGRWNYKGQRVIYLAESLSLAALENFVHLGPEGMELQFYGYKLTFSDEIEMDIVERDDLPDTWRTDDKTDTKEVGANWYDNETSLLLRVPSVIVPVEHNYLLRYPPEDIDQIKVHDPVPFSYDSRMWLKEEKGKS